MKSISALVVSLCFLSGCATTSADSSCVSSGTRWTNGNSGSSQMNPGMDCIACHGQGEGPHYAVAGTVYSALDDADTCDGLSGIKVELKSVDTGETVTATSNSAGNFYLNSLPFSGKYTARVLTSSGAPRAMTTPQTSGACNSCHTAAGLNGAPGRIVVP
jgi:hypothetical protein